MRNVAEDPTEKQNVDGNSVGERRWIRGVCTPDIDGRQVVLEGCGAS